LTIRGNYNSVNHTAAIFDTGAANIGAWYTLNLVPLRDNQDIGHQSLVAGCSTYRNIYYKGDLYPSNFKVHLSSEGTSVGDSLQIFTTSASWGAGIQPAPAPDSQCRISTGTIATGSVELVFGDSVTTAGNLIGYESIIHIPLTMKLIDFTLGSTISGEVTVEVSSCATAGGVFVVVSTGEMLSSQTDNANSNLGNWTITTMDRGWMKFKILYAATVKQITMSMGIKKL
jgi:hypothetical protein